jgi:hypothetical protein
LLSAKKLTRPAAAGGGINISIRKVLTIVSAICAADRSIVCIGP